MVIDLLVTSVCCTFSVTPSDAVADDGANSYPCRGFNQKYIVYASESELYFHSDGIPNCKLG